jgi:hypothetical protein
MGGYRGTKDIHLPRRTETAAAARDANAPGPTVTTTFQMPANGAPKTETPITEEAPSFWEKMLSIPKSEWADNCTIWIYRLEPRTRMLPGERGYLDILTEPITPDYIKKRWGGGVFRIILNRSGKIFAKIEEPIEGEPIYDRREAATVPANGNNGNGLGGNADFQKEFISVLREELQRSRESNQGQSNGSEHVIEMLTKASERAMEIVTKQAPPAQNGVSQIREMVGALRDLGIIGPSASAGGGLKEILSELKEMGLISKPKNLAEQLAEMKTLQELVAGGGGEPKDWKAAAVQAVTQHLPEILETFKATSPANVAQARANEAQARARAAEALRVVPIDRSQPGAQPQPAAPAPTQNIRVEGGLNLEPRDGAAPAVEVMPAAEPAPAPVTQQQYDEGMKVQVVNMMRYGASGSAIAMFLEDVKPDLAKDMVNYPEQTITAFFSQDPILKLMVEDSRWHEVLKDARDYLTEDEVTVGPN